jgi:hypothetical protein
MTEEQISQTVNDIRAIANNHVISTGTIIGLSTNPHNAQHLWTIDTHKDSEANYTVKLDSLEDAISIIHEFSNNPKEDILKYFEERYSPNEENYLHYSRTPIGV